MGDEQTWVVKAANGQEYGPATLSMIGQWVREGRIVGDAVVENTASGSRMTASEVASMAAGDAHPPVSPSTTPGGPKEDSVGSVIIPYKNPPALVAYYLGLFSLLPLIGIALAVPAFVLGIVGLRKRAKTPEVHGAVHAWIGIIMGALMGAIWGFAVMAMFWM